ncbi:MAG: toprim domain-containing protein, partial [Selenomonadaceae bacterium]|nr:toprim domain-containing protein [Selenomonadaceae bacterium]
MKNFEKNSQIKEDIKKVNPDVLINRGYAQESPDGNIVCPFCGNGSHDNGTGVSVTQDAYGNWRGHCFACGETFDNLTLIAKHYGYDIKSDFPKVLKEGATLLGSSADFGDFKHNHKASAKNYAKRQQSKKADELPTDHSKFLDSAFLNLEDLPENVRRGLDLATLIHFNNGFDSAWQHPDSPKMPKTPRWIIPTSKHHYLARAISDDVKKEFRKIHTGSKEIFNIDALQENCTVLVVEGEIDVMSIWQATKGLVPCVAVSGCTGYNLLLKWLEKNPDCNCSFIVVFDNDSGEKNSGQNAATKFVDELTKKGVPAVNKILSFKKDFDANDWLMEDPDALRDRIFEIYDEGSAELETIYDKVLAEKAFNKKVADFELANGEINPAVLPEVKSAIETLDSLTEKNFDGNLLNDESFRRQLGLCSFYNFAANSLSKFWSAFNKKRKLANAKVKTDFELDDDEHVIRNFSENDIRKLMKKYAKLVESQHNDFNKEQQRKRREEYRQQKQAEEEQLHADIWEQLNFLKSQPQTVERDKEIRRLILELCDWLKDKNGERLVPKSTVGNFRLIFNLEPLIDGLFGKNDFTGATVFTKEPFWTVKNATSRIGEPFKKEDFDVFANFVSDTYKDIACKVNFNRQISEYAVAHTFHPIKDYFDSLPK